MDILREIYDTLIDDQEIADQATGKIKFYDFPDSLTMDAGPYIVIEPLDIPRPIVFGDNHRLITDSLFQIETWSRDRSTTREIAEKIESLLWEAGFSQTGGLNEYDDGIFRDARRYRKASYSDEFKLKELEGKDFFTVFSNDTSISLGSMNKTAAFSGETRSESFTDFLLELSRVPTTISGESMSETFSDSILEKISMIDFISSAAAATKSQADIGLRKEFSADVLGETSITASIEIPSFETLETFSTGYEGKKAGSLTENSNVAKNTGLGSSINIAPTPYEPWNSEYTQLMYDNLVSLETGQFQRFNDAATRAFSLYSFDVINAIETRHGETLWRGQTLLAEKITISKEIVKNIVCNAGGRSPGAASKYLNLSAYNGTTYDEPTRVYASAVTVLTKSAPSTYIDNDGYIHFLFYNDAGANQFMEIHYANLDITLNVATAPSESTTRDVILADAPIIMSMNTSSAATMDIRSFIDFAIDSQAKTISSSTMDIRSHIDFEIALQSGTSSAATASVESVYPGKPDIEVTELFNAVRIDWQPTTNTDSYKVYRASDPANLGTTLIEITDGTTTFTDTTAIGGTTYHYTVKAINIRGSKNSDKLAATASTVQTYENHIVDFVGYTAWTVYDEAAATNDFGNVSTLQGGDRLKVDTSERLRFYLPVGMVGSANAGGIIKAAIVPKNDYTIEYEIRFDSGFPWSKGGKVPGFSGGAGYTGGDGALARTLGDGFSVRMMWREDGRIIPYVYHAGMTGDFGDTFGETLGYFTNTTAHKVKYYAVLNTGSDANGILKIYLDDVQIFEKRNLVYRTDDSKIDTVHLSIFPGGSDATWNMTADGYIRLSYISWT